jgi:hypothetical protein
MSHERSRGKERKSKRHRASKAELAKRAASAPVRAEQPGEPRPTTSVRRLTTPVTEHQGQDSTRSRHAGSAPPQS